MNATERQHVALVATAVEELVAEIGSRPEVLDVGDGKVAVLGLRFLSSTEKGRTHDLSIRTDGTVSCECWPHLNGTKCPHITALLSLHQAENRLARLALELRSAAVLLSAVAAASDQKAA